MSVSGSSLFFIFYTYMYSWTRVTDPCSTSFPVSGLGDCSFNSQVSSTTMQIPRRNTSTGGRNASRRNTFKTVELFLFLMRLNLKWNETERGLFFIWQGSSQWDHSMSFGSSIYPSVSSESVSSIPDTVLFFFGPKK